MNHLAALPAIEQTPRRLPLDLTSGDVLGSSAEVAEQLSNAAAGAAHLIEVDDADAAQAICRLIADRAEQLQGTLAALDAEFTPSKPGRPTSATRAGTPPRRRP